MNHKKTVHLTRLALFTAIMIIMATTPLGHIQMPFVKATTMHIPVIVGAMLFGPKFGAALGCVFGCTFVITSTLAPNVTSFAFSPFIAIPGSQFGSPKALLIAFIPRILIGVTAGLLYRLLSGQHKPMVACPVAAFAGTMTNVVLVLGGIYLLFAREYASAQGILPEELAAMLLGVVALNGVGETIAAIVISTAVVTAVWKMQSGEQSHARFNC